MSEPVPEARTKTQNLFARFWTEYLRQHRWLMALGVLTMIVDGSTLGLLSYSLEPLFDRVFVAGDIGSVWWIGGFIMSLFFVRATTSVVNRILMTRISMRVATAIQTDLFSHLLSLDDRFFQEHPPGQLIDRVQGDTAAVQGVWSLLITGGGRDAIALVSLLVVAISVDPVWAAVAVVGTPLLVFPAVLTQRYVRRKTVQVRVQAGRRATRLDEVFHGIKVVKLNRNESYQISRFTDIVRQIMRAEIRSAGSRAAMPASVDIATGIGFFAVILFGGREIAAGERTVGEFMSFFAAMSLAFQPMRRLGDLAGQWQLASVSLERLYGLFDRKSDIRAPLKPASTMPKGTSVSLHDVHLNYGENKVLNGLTFTAEEGRTTAIVGPSGAGKSTVFNLITRLVDPASGRVEVGGHDVRQLDLGALRDRFSVVTQEAVLFDESIRQNILLGRTDVSDATLARAMDAAHVSEFVANLPEGLDTQVGPRGSALSGGQRQRVAIARAVLRDAPILLLDEATSALDATSERLVQDALDHLSRGRTTLVIAHRLATVRGADKIVVMDQGRVVEEGTHDTLVARDGLYATLCRLQFSD